MHDAVGGAAGGVVVRGAARGLTGGWETGTEGEAPTVPEGLVGDKPDVLDLAAEVKRRRNFAIISHPGLAPRPVFAQAPASALYCATQSYCALRAEEEQKRNHLTRRERLFMRPSGRLATGVATLSA
jgi:hypothetical protein